MRPSLARDTGQLTHRIGGNASRFPLQVRRGPQPEARFGTGADRNLPADSARVVRAKLSLAADQPTQGMTAPQNHSDIEGRQQKLRDLAGADGLDAIALNAGPSLTYFTGLHFHLSERPVVCVVSPGQPSAVVLPELESAKVKNLPFEAVTFEYGENPAAWLDAFQRAVAFLRDGARVGVEPRSLRFLELEFLQKALPAATFSSAESVIARIRSRKDAGEIEKMRRATRIAEDAVLDTVARVQRGTTEKQIAAELVLQLLRHGSGTELPFQPIVSIGPNVANPHAIPTDLAVADGDILLIDWGASCGGYFSDLTRMFGFGAVDPTLITVVDIVREANRAGRAAAAPGVPAGDVDRAARSVIAAAGYADRFTHRTGHGLGLDVHEDPYIRDDNTELLEPGMVFTVEPGIYLPDIGGARIEDDVVITESGAESLSTIDRGLVPIG